MNQFVHESTDFSSYAGIIKDCTYQNIKWSSKSIVKLIGYTVLLTKFGILAGYKLNWKCELVEGVMKQLHQSPFCQRLIREALVRRGCKKGNMLTLLLRSDLMLSLPSLVWRL
ncbi:hypothetical protein MKW98_016457, partial [Papaver atlanticum]